MPDIWMDVDTALSEVPVNIMSLLDDTDFKTRETAVAYNASGMDLVWNFVTTGGAFTQTAVTPTTGGTYDWTHQGDGMYTIEIPASGGASINNDTEGFGWFTGLVTGVLPWRGPIIGFRASGLNNALIDSAYSTTRGLAGTALPAAAADAAGGLPISDAGGLDLDTVLGRITGNVALASVLGALNDSAADGDPTTGDTVMQYIKQLINVLMGTAGIVTFPSSATPGNAVSLAEVIRQIYDEVAGLNGGGLLDAAGIRSAVGLASANLDTQLDALPTAAENADAVWDEARSGHVGAGSFGEYVLADVVKISGDTTSADNLESYTDGTTPIPANVTQLGGVAQSLTDLKDFADDGYDPSTNKVQGVVLADTTTTLTNAPSDSAGITTLLSRLTATRAGYLDNLSAGAVATASKLLKYVQLILRKDSAIATDNSAEVTEINANGGSGAGAFANTTDALEAIRDRGDAAWITATGYSTLTQADIRTALGMSSANLDTQLGNILAAIPSAATIASTVWDKATSALSTAGSIGKLLVDNINAAISSRASQASVDTIDDLIDTEVAAILAAVDTEIAAIKAVTDNLPNSGALTNLDATISSRATPAQVNAEVVDALNVDTYSEPGQGAPTATPTIRQMIHYLYKGWRNKKTQTSTEFKLYGDNTSTVDQKAAVSDDLTTFEQGEIGSGP